MGGAIQPPTGASARDVTVRTGEGAHKGPGVQPVANLDVHVFRDRDGRYGARCSGRRGEREITARTAGWPGPAPAARHAIAEWVERALRTETP